MPARSASSRRVRLNRLILIAGSLTFVAPMMFPEVAQATVEDQRREVERIVDELDRLETQADILAEDWAEAEDNLRQLNIDVADAEASIAAKEAQLGELRGDLSEVAIRQFTGAGQDVLGPLFSNAASYGDGLRRDEYSRVALSAGASSTDDLDELISELEAERKDLQSKKEQVTALQNTIEDKQRQTTELTAQYSERRSQAEQRLGQLIAEEEQRRAEAAWAKFQADLAAEQAAASSNTGGGGGSNSGGGGGGGAAAAPNTASTMMTNRA